MTDTVQIDYEALQAVAESFGQQHLIAKQMYTSLRNHIEVLRAGAWQGEGANAFYAEMDSLLLPSMQRLMNAMTTAETTVTEIIQEWRIAEEEAEQRLKEAMTPDEKPSNEAGNGNPPPPDANHGNNGNAGQPNPAPNAPSGRTGNELNAVLDSFQVESNQRYTKFRDANPNTYDTYCNLFAADVAKRFNAPLPLFVTDNNGNITRWLGATAMKEWLDGRLNVAGTYTQGPANGWQKITHQDAVNAANNGSLVVVAGHGHMAVVRSGGDPNAGLNNVPIAQAGENNFSSGRLQNGWGQFASEAEFYIFAP